MTAFQCSRWLAGLTVVRGYTQVLSSLANGFTCVPERTNIIQELLLRSKWDGRKKASRLVVMPSGRHPPSFCISPYFRRLFAPARDGPAWRAEDANLPALLPPLQRAMRIIALYHRVRPMMSHPPTRALLTSLLLLAACDPGQPPGPKCSWSRSPTARRLHSLLRKQQKRPGFGRCHADHLRWPNAFFAEQGLFTLSDAFVLACQSR